MIKELIRLASHLDLKGFTREADFIDNIIKKAFIDKSIEHTKKFLEDLEKDIDSGWLTLTCLGRDKDEMPSTHVLNDMDLAITAETVKCVCKRKVLENNGTEDDYKRCVKSWTDEAIRSLPSSDMA